MSNQKNPEIYLMLLPNDRVSGVLEELASEKSSLQSHPSKSQDKRAYGD